MKNLISKEEKDRIDLICKKYNITKYSINSDGTIDVDGDVDLSDRYLTDLPLRFGKVSGNFFCVTNQLSTLVGSPHTVGNIFNCVENMLTSLLGSPTTVGGTFNCNINHLSNLIGAPHTVGGDFNCGSNQLKSTYSGDTDIDITGIFICNSKLPLPQLLMDNMKHIKLILAYQRYFRIWNDDITLNEENFQTLLDEIKDGLL